MQLNNIDEKKFLSENDAILIAVSGGIDSLSLLYYLISLKDKYHLKLSVAHVNHKRRIKSDEEYLYIESLCQKLNIEFHGMELNPKDNYSNFHDYAHKKRYEFFYEVAKNNNLNKIAVAHHGDDNIETILMRITRGTSFKGYAGIEPITKYKDLTIIRPFLGVSREEIIAYQKEMDFKYYEDESNSHDDYTRNRFRHHIIPLLKNENPNLVEKFNQLASYINDSYELISKEAAKYIENYVIDYSFTATSFNELHKIVKEDVIKKLINSLSSNQIELTYKKNEEIILAILKPSAHKKVIIKGDYYLDRSYDKITLKKNEPLAYDYEYKITDYGTYEIPTGKVIFSPNIIKNSECIYYKLCYNNFNCIFPITIRNRKNGDKVINKGQTKKVKDLFINAKIPLAKRKMIPIFLNSNQEIIFIPTVIRKNNETENKNALYIYYIEGGKSC